jgi:GlpG protein
VILHSFSSSLHKQYILINALEIPSEIDLSEFARFLQARRVPHRITEEGLNQVIWVPDEQAAQYVQAAFVRFQAGELDTAGAEVPATTGLAQRFVNALWRFPVTLSLILVTILFFPVGMGVSDESLDGLFAAMVFLDIEEVGGSLYFASFVDTYSAGEWWRLFSPMFIHFSWLHIVFNLLWVWEIGRRIELVQSGWMLAGLVAFSSVASNMTQFLMAGPGLFGGMSGVVFGLLGHSLIWSRLVPNRSMGVPNGIYIFMLIYLAIGFTGAVDLLGLGKLANGAHLGGLMAGLATGGLAGLLHRRRIPPGPR